MGEMCKLLCIFVILFLCGADHALGSVASTGYVNHTVEEHASDTLNPHNVTAAQVGLENVKNIDTTNANNITSGEIAYERIPVGSTEKTVASGDDTRFYTIPTSRPNISPPSGTVLVWFE